MFRAICRPVALMNTVRAVAKVVPQRFAVSDATMFSRKLPTGMSMTREKTLGYWLLGCSGMVVGAVVLGGVTRLTESGLSITEWQPIRGIRPPLSHVEWIKEFEKYQEFPEFKHKNQHITLSEFKWIWYMEYSHRLWGRAIGAAIALPAAFFWSRGWLSPSMKKKVLAFGALLGFQVSWTTLYSGLEETVTPFSVLLAWYGKIFYLTELDS